MAARELLGPGCDLVWCCPGDEQRGLLPHLVALDRWAGQQPAGCTHVWGWRHVGMAALLVFLSAAGLCWAPLADYRPMLTLPPLLCSTYRLWPWCRDKQAVVLGIAGDWQPQVTGPEVCQVPPAWLPLADATGSGAGSQGALAAAVSPPPAPAANGVAPAGASPAEGHAGSGPAGASPWAHAASLAAAEVLWEELEVGQLLQQLLPPAPCGRPTASAAGQAPPPSNPKAAAAVAAALKGRGLDTEGWQLVFAGHGVGAGAAALLALRLHVTWPGQCRHLGAAHQESPGQGCTCLGAVGGRG